MNEIKIRVLTAFPNNPENPFRTLSDLLPFEDTGVKISLSHNSIGALHCQSDIEHAYAVPGMAKAAIKAENEKVDAIVIESMGDTGLIQCREAVTIPVIGLSDVAMRIAPMLGRKFGLITANDWHGYALERLMKSYELTRQYIGFEPLELQPFFTDATSNNALEEKMVHAATNLVQAGADTILLGGSYFLGKNQNLSKLLSNQGYKNIVVIDPLPLAIRFARMMVESGLSHSKKIYSTPTQETKVIGYEGIETAVS